MDFHLRHSGRIAGIRPVQWTGPCLRRGDSNDLFFNGKTISAGAGFAALNDSLRVVQARQLADALRPQ